MDKEKKPIKGILKNTSSFDIEKSEIPHQNSRSVDKEMKWDEMNILATYHPEGKDYGHDRIDEPPTPYNRMEGEGERSGDESDHVLDPQLLAEGLSMKTKPKVFAKVDTVSSDEDEEENFTEEEKEKRKAFKLHRKQHYNEFQAVKLARQLLKEEEDEEDEEETTNQVGEKKEQNKQQPMDTNTPVNKNKNKNK